MDWTVGLPNSILRDDQPFESILTFIDRLSGMCSFVSARVKDSAEDTAVHLSTPSSHSKVAQPRRLQTTTYDYALAFEPR